METTPHGWKVFDASVPVLTYTYSFGPGSANALAAGTGKGLFVVSPPCRAGDGVFEDLSRFGPVLGLVASNAFHHLGLPEWKRRFPEASVFAPAQSLARVERQTGVHGIRPLADAAPTTGEHLELIDMPHYRTGEALVRARTGAGLVWYLTDVVLNMPSLPSHPVFRWMFRLTGSAPGLRFNNVAPVFMVKDKAALKRWLAESFDRDRPRWLLPAHGDAVEADADVAHRLFGAPGRG